MNEFGVFFLGWCSGLATYWGFSYAQWKRDDERAALESFKDLDESVRKAKASITSDDVKKTLKMRPKTRRVR